MAITERKMTLEEFLQLPEEEPALEYDDGVVTQKVSPQGKHGRLQMQLGMRLALFSEPRKLAMVFTELRTTFGGASPVPDTAGHRDRDRLAGSAPHPAVPEVRPVRRARRPDSAHPQSRG
jgi:Uma2 family endonuclease